jgi:hypothetical protein
MNNPDTIESLRAERDAAYKFIRNHGGPDSPRFYGDHACTQCHPSSEIIVEGFQCAYHKALSRTSEEGK